jgi:hypothetical protein
MLDCQISQFTTMDRLIWADSGDANTFLEAVDNLIGTVQEFDATGTNRALFDRRLLSPDSGHVTTHHASYGYYLFNVDARELAEDFITS